MLGRSTRLDPKTGKFSFKVLDFVGLCAAMEDNGKGTPKPNIKVVNGKSGGDGGIYEPKGEWFIIDNPDPAHLIQRVYLHGDKIQVIDNIPIEKARTLKYRNFKLSAAALHTPQPPLERGLEKSPPGRGFRDGFYLIIKSCQRPN